MPKTTVDTRVRQLLPAARRLVADGIDPGRSEFTDVFLDTVQEPKGLSDQQIDQLVDWAEHHYLLGVAVGLLLNPTTFLKGGAR